MSQQADVLIVGAGLAGLSAAQILQEQDISCLILETSDRIGGRIKTDEHEGFLLDQGFQILLKAYPEAQKQLNYEQLELHEFYNGSLIWMGENGFQKVADPWRHPIDGMQSIYNKIGTLKDKLKVAELRQLLKDLGEQDYWQRTEMTTADYLTDFGFSEDMINAFFRPFFAGIFLEPNLKTSSRFFEFVFRMFSLDGAALPARGMQAIPAQLAQCLPADSIRLQTKVVGIEPGQVRLENGETLQAKAVVVATDAHDLRDVLPAQSPRAFNAVSCLYFAAPQPPLEEPILVLNALRGQAINNLCVPSQIAPGYASAGQSLISVSVLGVHRDSDSLLAAVRAELKEWFGAQVDDWRLLKIYSVQRALPQLIVPQNSLQKVSPRLDEGLYVCGDYLDTTSINGALSSGRRAAEAVLQTLKPQALNSAIE